MAVALTLPGWGTSPDRLSPLIERLRRSGVDATAFEYRATGSIGRIGATLAAAVEQLRDDGPVHLVGHSLGGLASASAVLDHGADVASVTTVNTPWRGTWVAWTAADEEPLGLDLRWGADALANLRDRLGEHLREPHGPRWSVVAAAVDLAAPLTTALRIPDGPRLERAVVPVHGHSVSLLKDRMVDAVVAHVLGNGHPRSG